MTSRQPTPVADTRRCPLTGQPLGDDRYVSRDGQKTFADTMATLPAIMQSLDDLKTSVWSPDPSTTRAGAASSSRPPIPLAVLDECSKWERVLLKWVQQMGGRHLIAPDWSHAAAILTAASRMPGRPEVARMAVQTTAAVRALYAVLDPGPGLSFSGRCCSTTADGGVCDAPIYAPQDASWARCPECGQQWEIRDMLTQHMAAAADYMVTPQEGAVILRRAGISVSESTIRSWRHRRKLPPSSDGRYRVADLLTAATPDRQHRAG